ncbi:MAG: hypothetical protein ACOCUW_02105 [Gemmatimonadota bacterium]
MHPRIAILLLALTLGVRPVGSQEPEPAYDALYLEVGRGLWAAGTHGRSTG